MDVCRISGGGGGGGSGGGGCDQKNPVSQISRFKILRNTLLGVDDAVTKYNSVKGI